MRAFQRLPPALDDSRLLQLKEAGLSEIRVDVAACELVVGHHAETNEVAQRREVAGTDLRVVVDCLHITL